MSFDETLKTLVEKAAASTGIDVVDVRIDGRRHVRIWIDKEPTGVMIDDCAKVNRAVKRAMQDDGMESGAFHLEVLSPGLDRPLTREKDFVRFTGALVVVHLSKKRGDRRKFRGRLLGLREGKVAIAEEATGGEMTFSRDEIEETRLVPDVK